MINRRALVASSITIAVAAMAGSGNVKAFAPSHTSPRCPLQMSASENDIGVSSGRRDVLNHFGKFVATAALTSIVGSGGEANALDFDSFEKGQIEKDTLQCDPKRDPKCIPKLTEDEALCKYGAGGNSRGMACRRVKESGGKLPDAQPQVKSLGGAYAM